MNLDAVGIVAKDIKKSIEFYGAFGIKFSKSGEGHYEGTTLGGLRLMLDSVELMKKIMPDWSYSRGGSVTLCHKEAKPDAVDETYKAIVTAGHESLKEPWDAFWGQRYASVKDPDGNQVDIFADL